MSDLSVLLNQVPADSYDIAKQGFGFAKDLAQQLITLSSAILALTVTFSKNGPTPHLLLKSAWAVYLFSIVCGIWHMMALTGTLFQASEATNPTLRIEGNVVLPAALQVLSFIVATLLVILFGATSLRRPQINSSDSDIGKD